MNFPGNCFVNHESKKFWIDIPKNASKSVSHHLWKSSNWKNSNYIDEKLYSYSAYAVVRDPIQRWRGSTIEVAFHHLFHSKYDYSSLEKWFKDKNWKNFENIRDLHHLSIEYFTAGLENITWIALDNKFEANIQHHLEIKEKLVKLNSTEENESKKHIEPYVDEILSDPEFIIKLKNYYSADYDIFYRAAKNKC